MVPNGKNGCDAQKNVKAETDSARALKRSENNPRMGGKKRYEYLIFSTLRDGTHGAEKQNGSWVRRFQHWREKRSGVDAAARRKNPLIRKKTQPKNTITWKKNRSEGAKETKTPHEWEAKKSYESLILSTLRERTPGAVNPLTRPPADHRRKIRHPTNGRQKLKHEQGSRENERKGNF